MSTINVLQTVLIEFLTFCVTATKLHLTLFIGINANRGLISEEFGALFL